MKRLLFVLLLATACGGEPTYVCGRAVYSDAGGMYVQTDAGTEYASDLMLSSCEVAK